MEKNNIKTVMNHLAKQAKKMKLCELGVFYANFACLTLACCLSVVSTPGRQAGQTGVKNNIQL